VLAGTVAHARRQLRYDAVRGHRATRAELVAAQSASRLFLQQPIRAAGLVSCPHGSRLFHPACRHRVRGAGLDFRDLSLFASLCACDQQQCAAARHVLYCFRPRAGDHVDHLYYPDTDQPVGVSLCPKILAWADVTCVSPMTPSARLSAAIEVFAEINERRRPAPDALKDWGHSHRFAGSGDRAAIAGLVYDTLRRKSSSAWLMGEASPRAAVL